MNAKDLIAKAREIASIEFKLLPPFHPIIPALSDALQRAIEVLENIASAEEVERNDDPGDSGNFDDAYASGIDRGLWLQAKIAKEFLELEVK